MRKLPAFLPWIFCITGDKTIGAAFYPKSRAFLFVLSRGTIVGTRFKLGDQQTPIHPLPGIGKDRRDGTHPGPGQKWPYDTCTINLLPVGPDIKKGRQQ